MARFNETTPRVFIREMEIDPTAYTVGIRKGSGWQEALIYFNEKELQDLSKLTARLVRHNRARRLDVFREASNALHKVQELMKELGADACAHSAGAMGETLKQIETVAKSAVEKAEAAEKPEPPAMPD